MAAARVAWWLAVSLNDDTHRPELIDCEWSYIFLMWDASVLFKNTLPTLVGLNTLHAEVTC